MLNSFSQRDSLGFSNLKTGRHVPILFFDKTDVCIEPSFMKAQY